MAVKEGDIIEATVVTVTHFGALLEYEGLRGVLNITEMSWTRVNDPHDTLYLGQKIKALVIAFSNNRFHVSLKRLYPDQNPWRDPSLFAVGDTFVGRVTAVATYACFVQHPVGVDGFIHRDDWQDEYLAGQMISVKITGVDARGQTLYLVPEISETGHHVHDAIEGI